MLMLKPISLILNYSHPCNVKKTVCFNPSLHYHPKPDTPTSNFPSFSQ